MATKQRSGWLLSGRCNLLLAALAMVTAVVAWKRADLLLTYRIAAAQRAIHGREWPRAVAALSKSRARGETSPHWHYLLGTVHRRNGNLELASYHLAEAARLGWNPADVSRQQLLLAAQSGDIKRVEAELAGLLQGDASDAAAEETYEAMARGYLASWHVPEARKCLKFWIDFQPDNPLPYLWRGDLNRRIEDPAAAIADYRHVLRLAPDHAEARIKFAQVQLERLNVDEAAGAFEASLSLATPTPEALLGLAECRRREGATDDAKSLLYDALTYDLTAEQAGAALGSLGQIALEDRKFAPAVQLLESSVELDGQLPATRSALAGALTAAGYDVRAEAERAAARELVERHNRLVRARRRVLTEPENADLRCEIGLILMEQGMFSAGAGWLRTALQMDSGHGPTHAALAEFYRRTGNAQAAERHQRLATPSSPDATSYAPTSDPS